MRVLCVTSSSDCVWTGWIQAGAGEEGMLLETEVRTLNVSPPSHFCLLTMSVLAINIDLC